MLTEECSAAIKVKLPVKVKDPGQFMLPVEFEGREELRGLVDFGASISLMSFSLFKKWGIGEMKPARMSLQLADRTTVVPRGVVEDVLVKVGKFVFPIDFVVLDYDEDIKTPLILGRPFLATAKVKIDAERKKVSVKAHGKKMKFKMPDSKEKFEEQGYAFLLDMMGMWSDKNLKNFFRKEEISLKKKPPLVEEKLSHIEPVKNGLPSLKSIFKRDKKVDPKPIYYNRLSYVAAGMKNTFFDDSFDDMDKEIPGGVAHQGYNPG